MKYLIAIGIGTAANVLGFTVLANSRGEQAWALIPVLVGLFVIPFLMASWAGTDMRRARSRRIASQLEAKNDGFMS